MYSNFRYIDFIIDNKYNLSQTSNYSLKQYFDRKDKNKKIQNNLSSATKITIIEDDKKRFSRDNLNTLK